MLPTPALIDVIITRANLNGGTSITITEVRNMKGSGRASKLTPAILISRLRGGDLSGRLIAVEVVYDHPLKLKSSNHSEFTPKSIPLSGLYDPVCGALRSNWYGLRFL